MGLITDIDYKKYFIENSLRAFERHSFSETGFIHFDENKPFENSPSKASIFYSFLYTVTLFRTHNKESILKGVKLLKKLLYFQSSEKGFEGSFPKYMHEYPFSYDKSALLSIAMCLNIFLTSYSAILEEELLKTIEDAFEKLIGYLEYLNKIKSFSKVSRLRLESLLNKETLDVVDILDEDLSLEELSELVMAAEGLSSELKCQFYKKAAKFIHLKLGVFLGSKTTAKSYFGKNEQSLFEVVFRHVYSTPYQDFKVSDQVCMMLSLVTPLDKDLLQGFSKPSELNDFHINFNENYDLGKALDFPKLFDFQFLVQGELCSIVCEEKSFISDSKFTGNTFETVFTYPQNIPQDGPDQVELSIFLNDIENSHLYIDGQKATIFYLEDSLRFKAAEHFIDFKFTEIGGEGRLIGQISKGNRGSDKTPIEQDFSKAYDWVVSIRTLSRGADLKLKLEMTLSDSLLQALDKKEQESQQKLPSREDHYQHTE